jgi:hypothetical protein
MIVGTFLTGATFSNVALREQIWIFISAALWTMSFSLICLLPGFWKCLSMPVVSLALLSSLLVLVGDFFHFDGEKSYECSRIKSADRTFITYRSSNRHGTAHHYVTMEQEICPGLVLLKSVKDFLPDSSYATTADGDSVTITIPNGRPNKNGAVPRQKLQIKFSEI